MRPRIQPGIRPWVWRLGSIALLAGSGIACGRDDATVAHDSGTPASEAAHAPETAPEVVPPVAVTEPTPTPTLRPHGFAVVRSGAELRPGTDASTTPLRVSSYGSPGITVTAVGVHDGRVVVETGARDDWHCGGQLGVLDDFRLQWSVALGDLMTVTTKRITVPFTDGTKVELLAGVPLTQDGAVWTADTFGVLVRVMLPADATDTFYEPGDRELPANTREPVGLARTGGALAYDNGLALGDLARLEMDWRGESTIATFGRREHEGQLLVDVRTRCMQLTVVAPRDRIPAPTKVEELALAEMFALSGEAGEGGVLGALVGVMPSAPQWQVEPGAPVHTAAGAIVGQVERAHRFDTAPVEQGGRSCFTVPAFEAATLELCFTPTDVHELPGSSVAPSGLGGLGLGEIGVGGLGLTDEAESMIGLHGEGGLTGRGTIGGFGGGTTKPTGKVRGSDKPTITGTLDADIVRRIVKRHVPEVRRCYEKALAIDATLAGKLTLTFTIKPDGSVSSSRVSASTLGDDGVGDCVVAASKRWSFPAPEGGGAVVVAYPFVLSDAG